MYIYIHIYRGCIGVIGRFNGKEHGNCHLGFRVYGL